MSPGLSHRNVHTETFTPKRSHRDVHTEMFTPRRSHRDVHTQPFNSHLPHTSRIPLSALVPRPLWPSPSHPLLHTRCFTPVYPPAHASPSIRAHHSLPLSTHPLLHTLLFVHTRSFTPAPSPSGVGGRAPLDAAGRLLDERQEAPRLSPGVNGGTCERRPV
eukprot:scaffold15740_cov108-Isochrysis_galbana.AAC.1